MMVFRETLPRALMITGFVFIMMVLIEYLNVQTRGWWQDGLRNSGWKQYAIAVGLGAVPGCLGAFTVVSLYAHGAVSFGALVGTMIATSGDEAFVMLAMFPREALLLRPLGPDVFALVFLLIGFVMSGRKVGFEPYLLDIAPEGRRSIYVGINGTLNLSMVVLPALAGVFIDILGFTATFLVTVVAMVVAYSYLGEPRDLTFSSPA
jgi:hypothetical protein